MFYIYMRQPKGKRDHMLVFTNIILQYGLNVEYKMVNREKKVMR